MFESPSTKELISAIPASAHEITSLQSSPKKDLQEALSCFSLVRKSEKTPHPLDTKSEAGENEGLHKLG